MDFKKLIKKIGFPKAFILTYGELEPESWTKLTLEQLIDVSIIAPKDEESKMMKNILRMTLEIEVPFERLESIYPYLSEKNAIRKIILGKMKERAITSSHWEKFYSHSQDEKEKEMALEKLAEKSDDLEKLLFVLKTSHRGKTKEIAGRKIANINIAYFYQAKIFYKNAPFDLKKKAFEKFLELAELEQLMEEDVFGIVQKNSEMKKRVYEKISEKIANIDTIESCINLYKSGWNYEDKEIRNSLKDKILKTKLTIEELLKLCNSHDSDLTSIGYEKIFETETTIDECVKFYNKIYKKSGLFSKCLNWISERISELEADFKKWKKVYKKAPESSEYFGLKCLALEKMEKTIKTEKQALEVMKLTSFVEKSVLEKYRNFQENKI